MRWEIGGQFNIAKQIPGKEEFYETLRYYRRMLDLTASICGLTSLSRRSADFDEVILASGIAPRAGDRGIDHPKC
jgi:2,4-dienoyl-CoA reductase (NADPH2)